MVPTPNILVIKFLLGPCKGLIILKSALLSTKRSVFHPLFSKDRILLEPTIYTHSSRLLLIWLAENSLETVAERKKELLLIFRINFAKFSTCKFPL